MILPVYLTYFLLAQTELQWSLIFEGIRSMSWNELKTCDEVGISTFVGLLKAGVPLHILISYFFAAVVGLWFCWVAAMVQFAMFLCDRLARLFDTQLLSNDQDMMAVTRGIQIEEQYSLYTPMSIVFYSDVKCKWECTCHVVAVWHVYSLFDRHVFLMEHIEIHNFVAVVWQWWLSLALSNEIGGINLRASKPECSCKCSLTWYHR